MCRTYGAAKPLMCDKCHCDKPLTKEYLNYLYRMAYKGEEKFDAKRSDKINRLLQYTMK